jgi:hypothetical protein
MLRLSITQRETIELDVRRTRGDGVIAIAADIAEAWPLMREDDVPMIGRVLAIVRGRA